MTHSPDILAVEDYLHKSYTPNKSGGRIDKVKVNLTGFRCQVSANHRHRAWCIAHRVKNKKPC
jgi:hypothetical protein